MKTFVKLVKFDKTTLYGCLGLALPILAISMLNGNFDRTAAALPNHKSTVVDTTQTEQFEETENFELISNVQINDLTKHDRRVAEAKQKRIAALKPAVKIERSNIRQLKWTFKSRRVGWDLPRDKAGVIAWMRSNGYQGKFDNQPIHILRRIIYAYEYDALYWGVHEKTGIAVSMIYAYFIIESVRADGRESTLFRDNGNPGGIKARKGQKHAKYFDDCFNSKGQKIKCNFAVYESEQEIIDAWAGVFNNGRYDKAKSGKNTDEIAKTIYKGGYHTAKNWKVRADVADTYWKYRQYFPADR